MNNIASITRTFAVALVLVLTATGLWATGAEEAPAAAADKQYVTDPTTGKVVTAPEYGGTLTIGSRSQPPHADPFFIHTPGSAVSAVAEKLGMGNWGIDRDEFAFTSQYMALSAITGVLAESWEISPDGLTYTFHIRQGVHWHDKAPMNGRALTAKDIEYNYHRYLGLGSGFTEPAPWELSGLKPLPWESITATDERTLVMKLKTPVLPALLTIFDAAVFVLPPEVIQQHGDTKDWRNFVGTGPFMLTDWVDGTSMTWTKNPDYWGHDEKYPQNRLPYVDELKAQIIPDEATRLAGLRSGKIDYLGFPSGAEITSLDQVASLRRTNPEIVVTPWWDRAQTGYALNTTNPPFDDIRVRRAMQMALDLETINNTYFNGAANATPQGVVGDQISGYYTPFEQWPEDVKKGYRHDPEGAKKLLAEAGYPNGFTTVVNHFNEWDLNYTQLAVEYWKAIGVDAEIRPYDRASGGTFINERTWEGMVSAIPTWNRNAAWLIRWKGHSTSVWDVSGIADPELDAIIEAAEAATTIEEQMRYAKQADMILIERQGDVSGPFAPKFNVIQPWVIGYNGEAQLGSMERAPIFARLWIDRALKQEMGY